MLRFIPHREVRAVESIRKVDGLQWVIGRVCVRAGLGGVEPWVASTVDGDDAIDCRVPVQKAFHAAVHPRGKR